jgi:hypothetical protein
MLGGCVGILKDISADLNVKWSKIIYASEFESCKAFSTLDQWYSTFFVRVPPDIISLQLCTPKVVGT